MSATSNCQSCGACCSAFRVSFYWAEADDAPGGTVPHELTNQFNINQRCMKGTDTYAPRCVALGGVVGESVSCAIYKNRPSPCREFTESWSGGSRYEACDRARARFGLPPLPEPAVQPGCIPVQSL